MLRVIDPRSAPIAIAALLLLAGCSGGSVGSPPPPAAAPNTVGQSRTFVDPAAGSGLLFVSDESAQTVYIYPQGVRHPAPVGTITSGVSAPNGLFVDKQGSLYVCNFGAGTVAVYAKGAKTPNKTLTGAGSAPIDVVVGVDGTVYVANFDSGASGTLLEYQNGSTTPSKTIGVKNYPEGLALDSKNDLFVAYQDPTRGDGEVLEFAPGSTTGKNLGIHIGSAGGATVDSNDNLLLVDQSVPGVDVFPPGATQPSKQIKGFALAFDLALNHRNTRLYVTQATNPPTVWEVTYPGGMKVQKIQSPLTSAYGVATSPDGSS